MIYGDLSEAGLERQSDKQFSLQNSLQNSKMLKAILGGDQVMARLGWASSSTSSPKHEIRYPAS